MRERARREFVTASLRSHLAEQPSPRAIRACPRRWAEIITHLADETVRDLNRTENE